MVNGLLQCVPLDTRLSCFNRRSISERSALFLSQAVLLPEANNFPIRLRQRLFCRNVIIMTAGIEGTCNDPQLAGMAQINKVSFDLGNKAFERAFSSCVSYPYPDVI